MQCEARSTMECEACNIGYPMLQNWRLRYRYNILKFAPGHCSAMQCEARSTVGWGGVQCTIFNYVF
eukprot:9686293-Karenia_brevis.AAC.1